MPLVQSGSVTPGHVAQWATDGVLQDGGTLSAAEKVLASFRGADFNSTADQKIALPARSNAVFITRIIVTNTAVSLTTAAGGFYPQTSKGGTAIVAAGQVYSTLTSNSVLLQATLAAAVATTRYSATQLPDWALYFSLTTAQGVPATADIYVTGIDLT